MTTTLELTQYYPGLLIIQYHSKPNASSTVEVLVTPVVMPQTSVQEIVFSSTPSSGTFILSYGGISSAVINWNDAAGAVQTKLQAISGLGSVIVTGSISPSGLVVTFIDVTAPALSLVLETNSLGVSADITETDLTLPLAVQDGFNLNAPNVAAGVQLDVIGEYAGVSRTGQGFTTQITLGDTDFLSLIQMAIIKNSSGSSLYEIQKLINQFFAGEMLVFDYKNMHMSYLISTAIGSQDLVQLFVTEGLLPKPMGVQVAVIIYAPIITTFFGFRTYQLPAFNASPFNSYTDYHMDYPWLSYQNAIVH